jgi:hypothetical protein
MFRLQSQVSGCQPLESEVPLGARVTNVQFAAHVLDHHLPIGYDAQIICPLRSAVLGVAESRCGNPTAKRATFVSSRYPVTERS